MDFFISNSPRVIQQVVKSCLVANLRLCHLLAMSASPTTTDTPSFLPLLLSLPTCCSQSFPPPLSGPLSIFQLNGGLSSPKLHSPKEPSQNPRPQACLPCSLAGYHREVRGHRVKLPPLQGTSLHTFGFHLPALPPPSITLCSQLSERFAQPLCSKKIKKGNGLGDFQISNPEGSLAWLGNVPGGGLRTDSLRFPRGATSACQALPCSHLPDHLSCQPPCPVMSQA